MKKNIRKAFAMAFALIMMMTAVAQADVIVSPAFTLPGAAARPTEIPTVEPTASPTEAPAAEPTAAPAEEPTAQPAEVPAEEPTAEPTAVPVEEPEDEPISLSISCNLAGKTTVVEGTVLVLTLNVEGAEGRDYTIRWQQTKDGVNWEDIPGANGMQYSLALQVEHSGMYWRACLDMADTNTGE